MSAATSTHRLSDLWQTWTRFWLQPGDPTTMSFLRIIAGCLCLYVYSIYSFDLDGFFGKHAWYDLETANRLRHEEPTRFPNLEWDHQRQVVDSASLPEGLHDRSIVMAWLRSLPPDAETLAKKLRLFDTESMLNRAGPIYPATEFQFPLPWFAVEHALVLSPDAKVRAAALEAIKDKSKRDRREAIPEVFDRMSGPQLTQFVDDLDAFYTTLPQGANGERDRRVVVWYLQNLTGHSKNRLLAFLRDTRDSKTCTPAQRDLQLEFFERWGIERRTIEQNGRFGHPIFSIWFHITEPLEMAVAHGVVLLILLMFTLGLFTRITAVLTWLVTVSYIHRNPQILFGQDTMMNILLIYLMIAKSGAVYSLDRLIERYRATRASIRRCGTLDARTVAFLATPMPSVASNLATRMLQVHFCFIYMAAGLSKLKGGTWWSTDAMWLTLVNPEFTMIHLEWYRNLLRWVFASRPLFSIVAAIGVGFTLFVEIGVPFLLWTRLRPWVLICGFGLHMGIGVFMGLLVFSLFMMTMLASFIPGWAIRDFISKLLGRPVNANERVKLVVDAGDDANVKKAAWAIAWDRRAAIELVPK